MAPPPPSPAWPLRHHLFLRQLLLLAIVRPAMPQFLPPSPPPPDFSYTAFSPPSPSGSGSARIFNLTTSLLFLGLIVVLFFVGFFSAHLRRCASTAVTAVRRGGTGRGSVTANTAVAAAAAAAFAAAATGVRRRNGLDAAVMEALPVMTYSTARMIKAGKGTLECAVCLAEFADDGETLRLLPGCCHVFHAACIDVWLAAHVTCPVCRADLSDQAVAAAGYVLAADLAAQAPAAAEAPNGTVIEVGTPDTPEVRHDEEERHLMSMETAEERVDRYTLRLPERLRREIEEAKRHRRAASAAAIPASTSSGRWASLLRTMSVRRRSEVDSSRRSGPIPGAPTMAGGSRRWLALFRTLSGRRRSELDVNRRVAPVTSHITGTPATVATGTSNGQGEKVEVAVDDMATHMEKYYAHSLTFAGFVIDGDVAAGDWHPEIFQVSTSVQIAAAQP